LFFEIQKYEDEIVSNHKLICYGELKVKFCTHRPSRSEIGIDWKMLFYLYLYFCMLKVKIFFIQKNWISAQHWILLLAF